MSLKMYTPLRARRTPRWYRGGDRTLTAGISEVL